MLLTRSRQPFYLTTIASMWFTSTIGVMTAVVNTAIVILGFLAVATRRSTNAGLLARLSPGGFLSSEERARYDKASVKRD
ncbi:hypothetical protein FB451DRAFT_37346 [Mycena latifolia]|nr:hypothetical protein FB451DRAFT_37346 [Mycena latifolia]